MASKKLIVFSALFSGLMAAAGVGQVRTAPPGTATFSMTRIQCIRKASVVGKDTVYGSAVVADLNPTSPKIVGATSFGTLEMESGISKSIPNSVIGTVTNLPNPQNLFVFVFAMEHDKENLALVQKTFISSIGDNVVSFVQKNPGDPANTAIGLKTLARARVEALRKALKNDGEYLIFDSVRFSASEYASLAQGPREKLVSGANTAGAKGAYAITVQLKKPNP